MREQVWNGFLYIFLVFSCKSLWLVYEWHCSLWSLWMNVDGKQWKDREGSTTRSNWGNWMPRPSMEHFFYTSSEVAGRMLYYSDGSFGMLDLTLRRHSQGSKFHASQLTVWCHATLCLGARWSRRVQVDLSMVNLCVLLASGECSRALFRYVRISFFLGFVFRCTHALAAAGLTACAYSPVADILAFLVAVRHCRCKTSFLCKLCRGETSTHWRQGADD